MVTEARENKLMDKAMEALESAGIPTMPRDEASVYLTCTMTFVFMMLRTVEDDEYLRGWMASAMGDLDKPPAFEIRKPS